MEEIAELAVGPVLLVEHSAEIVPHRRKVLDKRELVRLSNGRIDIDQRSNATRVFICETRDQRTAKREPRQIHGPRDMNGVEQFIELSYIHLIGKRNWRTVGISAAIVVVAQWTKSRGGKSGEGRIPNVIRDAETSSKHDHRAIGRTAKFVMSKPVGQLCELTRH